MFQRLQINRFLVFWCRKNSNADFGSSIWFDEEDEDESASIEAGRNGALERLSPEGSESTPTNTFREHKIRIAVSSGENHDKLSLDEINSCASVSVIGVDGADDRCTSPKPKPKPRSESVEKSVCVTDGDKSHWYNEKAIDVPKDFEEKAYAHSTDSPFVRNLDNRYKGHKSSKVRIPFSLFCRTPRIRLTHLYCRTIRWLQIGDKNISKAWETVALRRFKRSEETQLFQRLTIATTSQFSRITLLQ